MQSNLLSQIQAELTAIETAKQAPIIAAKLASDVIAKRDAGKLFAKLAAMADVLKLDTVLNDKGRISRVSIYIPGMGMTKVKPIVLYHPTRMIFITRQRTATRPDEFINAVDVIGFQSLK
jgi:hypothetical protein